MRRATIETIKANWGSGIAEIVVTDDNGGHFTLFADNAPLMRALDAMFPGFISEGHTVDVSVVYGHSILYETDNIGMLEGIAPDTEEGVM